MWAALVLAHAVEPCEGAVSSLPSTPRSTGPRAGEAGAAGAEAGDGEEEGGDNGAAEAGGGTKPEEDWEDTVERLLLTSEWTAPDAKFDDGCLRPAFCLFSRPAGRAGRPRTAPHKGDPRMHDPRRTHAPAHPRAHENAARMHERSARVPTHVWLHRRFSCRVVSGGAGPRWWGTASTRAHSARARYRASRPR